MRDEQFIPSHYSTAKERLAGRRGAEVEMQRLIDAHLETHAERQAAGAEKVIEVEHG